VLFRFQTDLGQVVRHFVTIPATSRRTVDLRLLSGLESANVSSVIESDVQVVVDRTMRWDQVTRAGAHAEASSPAPSLVWYLAEGATHGSFDLFYLLQNPSQTQTAQVQIRCSRRSTSRRTAAARSTSISSRACRPPTCRP
jgi:hypothetical protein